MTPMDYIVTRNMTHFNWFFFTVLILLCIMHPKTTEDVMIIKSVKALTAMAANEMIINGSPLYCNTETYIYLN